MVSPSNDDYIGYWNDAVSFLGSARPGSSVYIQAKNSRGNWVTIATTQAVASGSWAGVWQKSVVIPTSFWDHWGYNSIYEAEVRAAHMSGWRMLPLGNPVTILGWSGGPS